MEVFTHNVTKKGDTKKISDKKYSFNSYVTKECAKKKVLLYENNKIIP